MVYMVLLGGTEAGVFLLPFQIVDGLIAAALLFCWSIVLRRGHDNVDLLVLGALLCFLLSCLLSPYPRQSYEAALSGLAWAAAFGVARRLLFEQRYRVLCFRLMGVCGFLLALAFSASWGSIWLTWVSQAGGFPPADLALPAYIYRHYYVVAMLLAALLPASFYILRARAIWAAAALTIALSIPLCLVSGSRIVWLALLVAAIAVALVGKPIRIRASLIGISAGILAIASLGGLGTALMNRLFEGSTLAYRIDIWRFALDIWSQHPMFGIGPGAIGIGLAMSDLTTHYDFINRHADNSLIQIAAEGGSVGLIGVAILALAIARGRRMDLPGAGAAAVGLLVLGCLTLANNPTDSPNLIVIGVAYAAALAPFGGQARRDAPSTPHVRVLQLGTWWALVPIGMAVVLVWSATAMQGQARSALASGSASSAAESLRLAAALDPSMAIYHRDLGVLLIQADPTRAFIELTRATQLNPADGAAARARAMVLFKAGDIRGAVDEAERATALRPLDPENWLTVSIVADGPTATRAAAQALHLAPWLAGSPAWPQTAADGSPLQALLGTSTQGDLLSSRDPMASVWLSVIGANNRAGIQAGDRELDAVLKCDLTQARADLDLANAGWTRTSSGITATLMLSRISGNPPVGDVVRLAGLKSSDFSLAARGALSPYSMFVDLTEDPQLYRRLGIGPLLGGPILPRSTDALQAWLIDPVAAAVRSQLPTNLADCTAASSLRLVDPSADQGTLHAH
jgi:O-antigen ligase